jgi:biopolymer transport protein ExbD
MSIYRRRSHDVPGLNTASLPDMIFSVLFFFMIVTHMRKVELKVRYKVPAGTELTKLVKKTSVSYIYIGRPTKEMRGIAGTATHIQINDKYADLPMVIDYVTAERNGMEPEDAQNMTVSIKADKGTRMGIITDVKQALRQANALKVNYSAVSKHSK